MTFAELVIRSRAMSSIFFRQNPTKRLSESIFDDEIEKISIFDPLTGEVIRRLQESQFSQVALCNSRETIETAIEQIRELHSDCF